MNRDEITRKTSELSTIAHTTEDSKVEYWYARELMTYMGYDRWENFSKAITPVSYTHLTLPTNREV